MAPRQGSTLVFIHSLHLLAVARLTFGWDGPTVLQICSSVLWEGRISYCNLDCAYLTVIADVSLRETCQLPGISGEGVVLHHDNITDSEVLSRVFPLASLLQACQIFLFPTTPKFIRQMVDSPPSLSWIQVWRLEHAWWREYYLSLQSQEWLGVSGSGKSGSLRVFTVNGRLFTIASASHRNVRRDSSSNWEPFLCNIADITLRTVRIWHSQTPPIWLAEGTFILKLNQSQLTLSSSVLIRWWSNSAKASFNSPLAPMKLLPWSLLNWRMGPLRQIKRRSALMNEAVSMEFAHSRCMALDAMHVKRTPYLFISFLPSLMIHGPK